jgi:Fanconi-associated nuclease 1
MEKFKKEIGEEGLLHALSELCQPFGNPIKTESMDVGVPAKDDGRDVIDLTHDSEDEEDANESPNEFCPDVPMLEDILNDPKSASSSALNLDYFCEDEKVMSLPEILWTLKVAELKPIAKAMKIKHPNNVC